MKEKIEHLNAIENAEKEVLKLCAFLGNDRVLQIVLENLPKNSPIKGSLLARHLQVGMKVINPSADSTGDFSPLTITSTSVIRGKTPEQDGICFGCELGWSGVRATDVLFLVSDLVDTRTNHHF